MFALTFAMGRLMCRSVIGQKDRRVLVVLFLGLFETVLHLASQDADIWFLEHSIVAADDIVAFKWPAYQPVPDLSQIPMPTGWSFNGLEEHHRAAIRLGLIISAGDEENGIQFHLQWPIGMLYRAKVVQPLPEPHGSAAKILDPLQ
jgi:hypothetical protein